MFGIELQIKLVEQNAGLCNAAPLIIFSFTIIRSPNNNDVWNLITDDVVE
jgi:hypothetical protein